MYAKILRFLWRAYMLIILGINWLIQQLKAESLKTIVTYLGATIVVKLVVLQIPVMLQVSRVIQLTFMCSIRIFVPNIKTDTVCIQVTTVFTLVEVIDNHGFYPVVY